MLPPQATLEWVPFGWGVQEPGGQRALFLDKEKAVSYAARVHGTLVRLYAYEYQRLNTHELRKDLDAPLQD